MSEWIECRHCYYEKQGYKDFVPHPTDKLCDKHDPNGQIMALKKHNERVQPREYTTDEVRDHFLSHVEMLVGYWEKESGRTDVRGKLEGLAFSIMSALDGCAAALPGFVVAPEPHPDDKEYNRSEGCHWYPENHDVKVRSDIAGSLHEQIFHPRKSRPRNSFFEKMIACTDKGCSRG